ncbi:MAG TPA: hypothetical protein VF284_11550 [Rhodanobacteraceae bacterium]
MKISCWMAVAVVAATLVLQGCAGGGDIKYAPGAEPSTSNTPSTPAPAIVSTITTKSDFEAVQAAIQQQMQPGKRYGSVDPAGRVSVNEHFQDMAALFSQYGTVDKMGPGAQDRINGDQNAINAVLAAHDGRRLICHNEMPVGSHLPKRVCRSLSEIRNDQNNSQQMMRQMQMKPSELGGH